MRIWDVSPVYLCRQHLLGEYRELHALWAILSSDKTGYRQHPETKRWEGKLAALYQRHRSLVSEMVRRGYRHHSPLPLPPHDQSFQDILLQPVSEQVAILQAKPCPCPINAKTSV